MDKLFDIPEGQSKKRHIPAPTNFASPSNTRGMPKIRRSNYVNYTDGLARKICRRLMEKETLAQICSDKNMPSLATITRWLVDPKLAEFREMYYYARRVQAEMLVDEIIEIADETENDWKPTYNRHGEQNGWKPDNEAIQRSRVRIDTRKWLATKLVPRIYGDHLDVQHGVSGDLAKLIQSASNKDTGLPAPIDGKAAKNPE